LPKPDFLGGTLIIPLAVYSNSSRLPDSADSVKNASAGGRGLDMLAAASQQQQHRHSNCRNRFSGGHSRFENLSKSGKQPEAVIITNDFNLNKVSELRGVSVLNNELANAPAGRSARSEAMRVFIFKRRQGIQSGVVILTTARWNVK